MAIKLRHVILALVWGGAVNAQAPLSAIDWLNQTPTVTLDMGLQPTSPAVTGTALSPEIGVEPLGVSGRDAVGLLPSNVTGLPDILWQNSPALTLAEVVTDLRVSTLPAIQALLYTLLLAEANPPDDAGTSDTLLLARIDKLIELGALEQANALLERAGPNTPELFRRWFDVTLLMGQEDFACNALQTAPYLAPGYPARIFCTARAGDWNAAALTLDTAQVLGLVSAEEDAVLARFLDPDVFEGAPILVAASAMTPLKFRLYEAIGEPHPTRSLARAYAHSDLRETAGWKSQLEAAERLARTGAIPENRLLGIYSARKPAASGMIWDRVAALQRFETAVTRGDSDAIAATLPAAWAAMQRARLEVPFAQLFGETLLVTNLSGVSRTLARDIALLSGAYERAAAYGRRDFAALLAQGRPPVTPQNPTERAISEAFHGAGVPQEFTTLLAQGRLGEVILRAMALMESGADGDPVALTESLATLRAVGLEDTARRAALQVLLLKPGR